MLGAQKEHLVNPKKQGVPINLGALLMVSMVKMLLEQFEINEINDQSGQSQQRH